MIYGSNGYIKFNDVSIIVTLAIWRQKRKKNIAPGDPLRDLKTIYVQSKEDFNAEIIYCQGW